MTDFERKVMEAANKHFGPYRICEGRYQMAAECDILDFARAIREIVVPEGYMVVKREPDGVMLNLFANEMPEPVFADRNAVHRVYGWAAIDKIYRAMTQTGELK